MADPTQIIAPSPEDLAAFYAACERVDLAIGRPVRQVQIDQFLDLLKQPPQTQQEEAQSDD
jgi:hypothetical protein